MHHYRLDSLPAPPADRVSDGASAPPPRPARHRGHAHFWERAFSRRHFVRTASGATALVLGQGLWFPHLAGAAPVGGSDPRPIPIHPISDAFGLPPLFVDFPWFGNEVSTITDFDGAVACAEVRGQGTGTDTRTGQTTRYTFDADMRFMDGTYVSLNGQTRRGTFGFI
jgi:hypothetical protein